MNFTIDLGQAVQALTDMLDLVGVEHACHGKRVGLMALSCGRALGMEEPELGDLFHAGLLHDCGVSSTQTHHYLVTELDWKDADEHCVTGSGLLSRFVPLAHLAPVIRYHHTHWDALTTLDLPEPVARWANLIYLVDRADALMAPFYERPDFLLARYSVRKQINALRATFFDPELVDLFMDLSNSEAFWLALETRHLIRFMWERAEIGRLIPVSFMDLKQLALIFAQIVDAKSPYTMEHSLATARLARFLAERAGLPPETCEKIEVAGLLHDLGKLQVPDEILEKPGSLTGEERAIIQRHSFETYQILRGIQGLEDITLWAASHHETLDGQGYPFHRSGAELTLEMRIIAVADVFQAMAQRRPYRNPLPPQQILDILQTFVQHRRLDEAVVSLVAGHLNRCWRLATGQKANDANENSRRRLVQSARSMGEGNRLHNTKA